MAGLVDTGGNGRAADSAARLRVDHEERIVEREYRAHRDAVLAMLAVQFPRLVDPEELYQEAWAELLELELRGELVRNRRALLKTIAWRADLFKTNGSRHRTADLRRPRHRWRAVAGGLCGDRGPLISWRILGRRC